MTPNTSEMSDENFDYYDASEDYEVDGVKFRIIAEEGLTQNGREKLVQEFMKIDPSIITAVSVIPWLNASNDKARVDMSTQGAAMDYTLTLMMYLGYVVMLVPGQEKVYDVVLPFTLPPGFKTMSGFVIYEHGKSSIGLEIHPDYLNDYIRAYNRMKLRFRSDIAALF